MSKKYKSVVLVRWELPFPLRLPQQALLCWEPGEGVALFDPEGCVGSLNWKRKCEFFKSSLVFQKARTPQDPRHWPIHNYTIKSELTSGEAVVTAELYGGSEGGFTEARPYTVANIFLCVASKYPYKESEIVKRASASLNNLVETYRFLTLDPFPRPLHNEDDHYCTTISKAHVPEALQYLSPENLLNRINQITFGSTIGKDRSQIVGTNSFEDLVGNSLAQGGIELLYKYARTKNRLELFHQLIFSSIRRLKRREGALAIIDAQSAFEAAVTSMLKNGLISIGWNQSKINNELKYTGSLHSLNKRLKKLDEIAKKAKKRAGGSFKPFLGSIAETEWRQNLYNIRHEVVHRGLRYVSFKKAKRGIVVGLKAISFLHKSCSYFERQFIWSGKSLELEHIKKSPGRLFRIFEV
ncbi:MAG: hypothetical protein ACOC80_13830 [Petrotogales bacterium]